MFNLFKSNIQLSQIAPTEKKEKTMIICNFCLFKEISDYDVWTELHRFRLLNNAFPDNISLKFLYRTFKLSSTKTEIDAFSLTQIFKEIYKYSLFDNLNIICRFFQRLFKEYL